MVLIPPDCSRKEIIFICKNLKKHLIRDGDLIYSIGGKEKVRVISVEHALNILKICHDNIGHVKIRSTRERIASSYYWPGFTTDIASYIALCQPCQYNEKIKTVNPTLTPIKVSDAWTLVGMDLIGPLKLTKNGNKYILTLTDYFTKWVDFFPLKDKSAEEVSQNIQTFILRYGQPLRFLTDNGREFVNAINERLFALFDIRHSMSAAYHPQTNGLDERTNQTLKERMRTMCNPEQDNWDEFLEIIAFGIRTQRHNSTKKTPYEMLFGRKVHTKADIETKTVEGMDLSDLHTDVDEKMEIHSSLLKDLHAEASKNIEKAQKTQCKSYAKRKSEGARVFSFNIGDEVLKKNMRSKTRKGGKMEYLWLGPYIITRMKGNRVYVKKKGTDPELKMGISIDQLKPFHSIEKLVDSDEDSRADCYIFREESGMKDDEPKLVVLAKKLSNEIEEFLKSHEISDKARPHVSSRFSPFQLKKEHPQIYENVKARLRIPEDDLDMLNSYLVSTYKEYLVGTDQVTGRAQLLEDLTDFLIKEYGRFHPECDSTNKDYHEDQDSHLNQASQIVSDDVSMYEL